MRVIISYNEPISKMQFDGQITTFERSVFNGVKLVSQDKNYLIFTFDDNSTQTIRNKNIGHLIIGDDIYDK